MQQSEREYASAFKIQERITFFQTYKGPNQNGVYQTKKAWYFELKYLHVFLCVLVMIFLFIGQKLWQIVLYVHLCLWKDVYYGVDMGSDALGREVCYHRQKIILSRLCTFRTIEI